MDPKLLRMYSDILGEQAATTDTNRPADNSPVSNPPPKAPTSKQNVGTAAGYKGTAGAQSIAQASGIKDVNKIKVGQTINLPGGGTYQVKKGDTLDKIARRNPTAAPPSAPSAPAGPTATDAASLAAAQGKPPAPPAPEPTSTAADQTTPDQMRTTSATTAQSIGATNLQGQDPARQNTAAPIRQGGYAASATGAEGQGGTQAAMPTTQEPVVTSSSGAPITTGSGGVLRSRTPDEIAASGPMGLPNPRPAAKPVPDTSAGTGPNLGTGSYFEEELEEEVEESLEEELAEAFNDMLRLSGIQLNEKAVSKQQQKFMGMVHAMQKGEKVKGASPELKKVAKSMGKKDAKDFASTKHKGLPSRVDEGFRVMMDEEGHTLEHIVNRFKHEAKIFLNTGEMSDKLYDALYDYYLDRGEMPYGIAKAREGDPYTWVAARFEADIDGTVDVKMPVGEVAGDETLNELARLAGLSEGRVDECGDMGMDMEDRLNVSTNMSSDGTKSVNISAQGEKAEELLSMLKLAGMGGSDRPAMVVVGNDEEMMDEGILGDRTYNRVMPIVKRIASEVSDYDRDEFGEEMWSLLDQKYGPKFAQAVLQDDLDFYWNEYTDLTGQGLDEERETEYANTPEEEYQTVASITRQGNDLNREKKQFANMPKAGDNPMATDYMLDEELSALLDSVLVKEVDPRRPKGDTGIADIYTADKGIAPPSPDEGPVGLSKADIPKTMKNMPLPKDTSEPSMKNMPLPKAPSPSVPKAPVIAPGIKR